MSPPLLARLFLPLSFALHLPLSLPAARAQEYAHRAWETDDGLPHNGINALVQRRDGFLWLATQNGLVRFDGLEFRKWRSPLLGDAQTSSIRSVIEEDAQTLLVANEPSGLLRLRDGEITPHPLAERIIKRSKIALLFRESNGVFWILFANREAWRCTGTEAQVFPAPPGIETFWPVSAARAGDGTVYIARGAGVERYAHQTLTPFDALPPRPATICSAADGRIWIGSAQNLARLENGAATIVQEPAPWTPDSPPMALLEDRAGALWIGTKAQGVLRWFDGRIVSMPVTYPRINDLLEDDIGNIWVATAGGGLNRLQPALFSLLGEERGFQPNIMGSVCEDAAGDIWFANRINCGRLRHHALVAPPFPPEFLRKAGPIAPDSHGNLWMVAGLRVCRWKPGRNEPPQWVEMESLGNIHALFTARDGAVWVAGDSGPILCFRDGRQQAYGPADGYDRHLVQAIGESASGEIWVGTEGGELFQQQGPRFVRHDQRSGLPQSGIRAIRGGANGTIWICTGGGGLVVRHRGKFTTITELHGLPDDTLSQVLEDDFGLLWFGASRGLFKIRVSDLMDFVEGRSSRITPIVFGKSDGLTGFSATANYQPSAWKARDGRLWFATRKGLVSTMPERPPTEARGPRVYLDLVTADQQPVNLRDAKIPSSVARLDFHYASPIYSSADQARFRHRLEGYDADWIDAGTQRSVSYSHLPPGRYVFHITAGTRDLVWSPAGASFAFEILPAWWETRWARIGAAALFVAGLIALVRHWSHRRLRARVADLESRRRIEAERARIARDLHDSLGASLTQAGMLAEELSEDCHNLHAMKECSSELAHRVRLIARDLDAAVWTVSPKHDSLSSLCSYLCQFSIEYFRDTPTRCRVHTSDDIPATPLTPEVRHHLFLTAREACNNVLKHSGAREIQFSMRLRGDSFELSIEDNGQGFSLREADAANRSGLRNMRARIAEIGGRIEFSSEPGRTTVLVTLPLGAPAPRGKITALH